MFSFFLLLAISESQEIYKVDLDGKIISSRIVNSSPTYIEYQLFARKGVNFFSARDGFSSYLEVNDYILKEKNTLVYKVNGRKKIIINRLMEGFLYSLIPIILFILIRTYIVLFPPEKKWNKYT